MPSLVDAAASNQQPAAERTEAGTLPLLMTVDLNEREELTQIFVLVVFVVGWEASVAAMSSL